MGTLGTFDSFTTARLGIYAAQHGLKVTGNNISNINTAGYTRQRIDQVSFKCGTYDRYRSMMDNHVGQGALVVGINQIRDPYLDVRYRTTSSDTSYYDTKLSGLQEIAAILDEVGKGGKDGDDITKGDGLLYASLQKLAEQLRAFSASPTSNADTLVRGAADAITSLFNKYADRLEKLRQDYEEDFTTNISLANKVLYNIRDLNKSIRECEINGDNALEMRDERNRQIDQLSEYMNIKVVYSMEDVGAGVKVEKLTILLGDSNPDPNVETDSSILVDGLYATQLSVPEEKPVVNPYFGSKVARYEDIKDYIYLKEYHVDDIADAPAGSVLLMDDENNPIKDKDGKLICVVGTNEVDEATKVPNDNYTVQLGKLLDTHDEKWKDSTTEWTQVTTTKDGGKAAFRYGLSLGTEKFADGDTIEIGGTTFTVGQNGFTEDIANDAAQLATFIAGKLTNTNYDITAQGSNIVFTAKNVGLLGGGNGGPADPPELTLANGGDKISLGARKNLSNGADADPTLFEGTKPGDDINATETTTAYTEVDGKFFRVEIVTKHTMPIALDDNDLHGELQAQRELLTGEGEFASDKDVEIDEGAAIERGIPYYQKSFDLLAQKFAEAYNELNTGYALNQKGNYIDKDGKEILLEGADAAGNAVAAAPISKYNGLTPEQERNLIGNGFVLKDAKGEPILDENGNQQADINAWLDKNGGDKMGGPLFSNRNDRDDTDGITAANISVSNSWSHGAVQLIPKFEKLFADDSNPDGDNHSTQNINADHMVSMIDKALTYNPADLTGSDATGPLLFKGSFNDMFNNLMGVQAKDASVTSVKLTTSATTLVELDSSREGVSGVDLNDEAMNLMQYQKAYSAACRLMTTIDEALDRLINNTGVVGR